MPISPDDFEKNNVDVGAVITQDFLERFSTAHHEANHDIYHGTQVVKIFDPPLNIQYDVNNPIVFNLAPIPPDKFKSVWISHLKTKGAGDLKDDDPVPTPPNVKISVSDVNFTFSATDPDDPDLNFKVSFDWDLQGTCAIEMIDLGDGKREIKLEPIKITLTKHPNEVMKEISKAFEQIAQQNCKHPIVQNDDTEKLILYFTNQILSLQMSNFIREFELPRAIELIKGKEEIIPTYMDISQNTLAVGAQFHSTDVTLPQIVDSRLHVMLDDFNNQFDQEFRTMYYEDLKKWQPENSPSFMWLKEKHKEFDALVSQRENALINVGETYPENIQLFLDDKLFNDLAQSYLNYSKTQDYKKDWKVVKIDCGWSLNVNNGKVLIITGGLEAHVDITVSGWAKAAIPDPNPKHWGDWVWFGLGVSISPDPNFGIQIVPTFEEDGIYIQGKLLTQKLNVTITGLPKIADVALSWLMSTLSEPLFAVLKGLISLLHVKIIDYPTPGIPGTGLKIDPDGWRFNQNLVNSGPYLVLTADTLFSPDQ